MCCVLCLQWFQSFTSKHHFLDRTREWFFFLLLLFKERDRRGRIDSSRLCEDNQGTARQLVSSEYRYLRVSLTGESRSGKREDSSKCLGPSVGFGTVLVLYTKFIQRGTITFRIPHTLFIWLIIRHPDADSTFGNFTPLRHGRII